MGTKKQPKNNAYRFNTRPALVKIERMLAVLQTPMDLDELAAALSVSRRTATCYINHLLATGQVHVCEWRRNRNGEPSRVFRAGAGRNAMRPRAYTNAQKMRRCRDNNPDTYLRKLARRRAAKVEVRRDPLVAALFGTV